jgi:putative transposase
MTMPRPLRLDLPGIPQHVIQRGNDRQPCFFDDADYIRYRADLRELALREGCAVHAYVLMTNHVHLLMTPARRGAVARLMQSLGRRYVRYVNDRYHRTGTLWEGRYKACLVDDGDYLLHCHRYIELNPLRAAMVADPADYRWSSHRHHAFGEHDPVVTPHAAVLGLASDATQRQCVYRALVMETVDPGEVEAIRLHIQRQHVYGTERFRANIEAMLGRSAGPQKIGRPRKSAAT